MAEKEIDENIQFLLSKCSDLLSPEEEKQLFQRLRNARATFEKLEKKRKRTSVESSQLGIARKQMRQIRERLITANFALVVHMSNRFWITYLTQDDLISEGTAKLTECVDKFDERLGWKFSTYLCQALFRAFSRLRKIEYKQHKNRIGDIADVKNQIHTQSSIEKITDIISIQQALEQNTAQLTEIELFVIRSSYGLDNQEQKTLYEISLIVALSKGRVQQIKESALNKLKEELEK